MPIPFTFENGNVDPAYQLAIKWQMLCSDLSKAALCKTVAETGAEDPNFPYYQGVLEDCFLREGVVPHLIVKPSIITAGNSYCIVTG